MTGALVKQTLETPLGPLLLVGDEVFLAGVWFVGQRHIPAWVNDMDTDDTPALRAVRAWLGAYFRGERPDPSVIPLALDGTPFQRRVWEALCAIPYGATRTYGELAKHLGTSPRAIGCAVGRNPISIIVPCHRVLGANDTFTGYAGGLDRKIALLTLEGALP